MKNLQKTLNFLKLTNQFRNIERDILLSKEKRLENDMEHSYQLAMISWYICKIENLSINVDKLIKYSIIHDLVEIYAGDTPAYSSSILYMKSKQDREKIAMLNLKKNFPEFSELHRLIQRYEEKKDAESRFVYAVDKLLPVLSIYLDEGYAWKTHNITVEMIIDKNSTKLESSPVVKKYFDKIITILKNKPEYFVK